MKRMTGITRMTSATRTMQVTGMTRITGATKTRRIKGVTNVTRVRRVIRVRSLTQVNLLNLFVLLIISSASILPAYPGFRVSPLFGDNMVIQRDKSVEVWGEADKGKRVTIAFNGQVVKAKADKSGRWTVLLPPMSHGGPYAMQVTCGDSTLQINNILVGDVWFCSGQSNMVWPVSKSNNAEQEIAAAIYPNIRSFNVGRSIAFSPTTDVQGQWDVCSPETVGIFSAVAYFFAREVHRETGIPIGIVNASWGGTEIEPWISEPAFASLPSHLTDHYSYTPETSPDSIKLRLDRGEPLPEKIAPNAYPSVLYNGMVYPFIRFPITGVIWYQGENNAHAGRSADYYALFPCLIRDWRKQWGYDFPFYWVQLASYKPESVLPEESDWAELRDAQHQTLSLPYTGEAVTIDIGAANDVHPRNKQDVGYRLALHALSKVYGKKVLYSGPVFRSMNVENGKVILDFDHVGSGLTAKNKYGYLQGFSIAGPDKQFVWAQAYINENNQVIVFNHQIPHPVFVRYAWSNNPGDANLFNKEGLPASPFQAERPFDAGEANKARGELASACEANMENIFKTYDLKVHYDIVERLYQESKKRETVFFSNYNYGYLNYLFTLIQGVPYFEQPTDSITMVNPGEHAGVEYMSEEAVDEYLKRLDCTPGEAYRNYYHFIRRIKLEREAYLKCIDEELAKNLDSTYRNETLRYDVFQGPPLLAEFPVMSKFHFLKLFKEFVLIDDEAVLPDYFRAKVYLDCGCKTPYFRERYSKYSVDENNNH